MLCSSSYKKYSAILAGMQLNAKLTYGAKLHDGKVQRAFKKVLSRAAITDFHFHDLRHTFATRLVRGGVDLYVVQRLMGHKSIKTTERYAHHCRQSLEPHVMVLDSCYEESYHDSITFEADVLANMSSN